MELTFIKERQLAGIEALKRKGIYKGRPKMVDEAEICKRKHEGPDCQGHGNITNDGLSSSQQIAFRLAQSIAALDGQI
jgi:DNA invertase Pin-like site-specific DNA recombinase